MSYSARTTVTFRGTKRELHARMRNLPKYIDGKLPDIYGFGRLFKTRLIYFLFQRIHDAYLVKSEGGTDDAGIKWPPLKQSTIAQRPLVRGDKIRLGILGKRQRGLLTPAENRLWKGIFASTFRRLAPKIGIEAAKAQAGKLAWAILLSHGAKTKLHTLGKRKVPIGIVTSRLLDSVTPGRLTKTDYIPPKDQLCKFHWGSIEFGSKVPYAAAFHKRRKLWPPGYKLKVWVKDASRKGLEALVQVLHLK